MFTSQRRRPPGFIPAGEAASVGVAKAPTERKQIVTTTRMVAVKKPALPSNAYHPPTPTHVSSSSSAGLTRNGSSSKSGGANLKRKAELVVPVSKKVRKAAEISTGGARDRRRKSVSSSSDESDSEQERLARVARLMAKRVDVSSEVVRDVSAKEDGQVECFMSARLVLENREAYADHFSDPSDPTRSALEWSGSELPTVTLEYPGIKAIEKFILLTPIHADEEYDPIADLLGVIRVILDSFLTPAQSLSLFAHTNAPATAFSAFLSAPTSRAVTPSASAASVGPSSPLSPGFSLDAVATPTVPLMRTLEKARAKKDGPTFLAAIERFNVVMRALKNEGKIAENVKNMKGVQEKVWSKVVAQVYARAVGPEIESLSQYEAFSDNVYGELLPKFVTEICQQTGLGPGDVFVDLGSGVGNCVLQAALATGCEAYGYENMGPAASLAAKQVVEAEARFRMYGISAGAMRTVEADFCEDPEVLAVLRRATVILVNNEVFSAGLNDRLSLLFRDCLPDNARIVSLKAFASGFTLSAYTLHSPLAIIDQGSELKYGRKSVSWKDEGGSYYIGRMDRGRVDRWKEKEEKRKNRKAAKEIGSS